MANVFDTAKYILSKTGEITTMKLQKLCYYSQAWSLAWDEAPLFNEEFEAWANGPVCRELFNATKGNYTVTEKDENGNINNLTENQKATIDSVLDYYGNRSAKWLSDLSHLEDPWRLARKGVPVGVGSSNIIPKDSMAIYYSGL